MNTLFAANIPDFTKWGTIKSDKVNKPRPHIFRTLEVTINTNSSNYSDIVHEMARSIASSRLDKQYLNLWEAAVKDKAKLSTVDMTVITSALRRGICHTNRASGQKNPLCNDNNFKGHLVEVLLFCLRIFLSKNGDYCPVIFEPQQPKANPATGGIDLLEIGKMNNEYYFQIWECKGTDDDIVSAFVRAANQVCDSEGTAYQSFMEAYACLQNNDILKKSDKLTHFVNEMPNHFYSPSPHASENVGGIVGTGLNITESCKSSFAENVGGLVANGHHNCEAVVIRISNFPKFREAVFQQLWNIY